MERCWLWPTTDQYTFFLNSLNRDFGRTEDSACRKQCKCCSVADTTKHSESDREHCVTFPARACSVITLSQQSYHQNKQTRSDSSSDPTLQCHSQMCFSSGYGAPSGQHVAAAQACCWLWSCVASTQRSFAVVYQPRHYPTNEMHITR